MAIDAARSAGWAFSVRSRSSAGPSQASRVIGSSRAASAASQTAWAAEEDAAALGRVLYLVHLAVLLFWLVDRSERQAATSRLLALVERTLPAFALAFKLPPLRNVVRGIDDAASAALLGTSRAPTVA